MKRRRIALTQGDVEAMSEKGYELPIVFAKLAVRKSGRHGIAVMVMSTDGGARYSVVCVETPLGELKKAHRRGVSEGEAIELVFQNHAHQVVTRELLPLAEATAAAEAFRRAWLKSSKAAAACLCGPIAAPSSPPASSRRKRAA